MQKELKTEKIQLHTLNVRLRINILEFNKYIHREITKYFKITKVNRASTGVNEHNIPYEMLEFYLI
jgi:hypothetical protein